MAIYSVTTTANQDTILAAANITSKAIAIFVQDTLNAKIATYADVLNGPVRDQICTAVNALPYGDPKIQTAINALK